MAETTDSATSAPNGAPPPAPASPDGSLAAGKPGSPSRMSSADVLARIAGDGAPAKPAPASAAKPAPATAPAPDPAAAAPPPPTEPELPPKLLKRLGDTERAHRQALQRAKELEAKLASLEEQGQLLDKDPLALLKQRGWDHDKLSQRLLEDLGGAQKPDPAQQALSEVEQLKAKLQEREQQAAAAQQEAQQQRQVAWLRDWSAQQGERTAVISTLGLEPLLHERITERVRAEGLRGAEVDQALAEEADALAAQWYAPVERQVRQLAEKSPQFRTLLLELARSLGSSTPADAPESRPHREPPLAPPTRRPATSTPKANRTSGLSPAERTAAAVEALRDVFPRRR